MELVENQVSTYLNQSIEENQLSLEEIEEKLCIMEESKWVIIQHDISEEKYTHISSEIEGLKKLVLEMSRIIERQNETLNHVDSNMEHVVDNLKKVNNELGSIKNGNISSTRLSYIKDYLIPGTFGLIGFLGLQTPIMIFLGLKFGLITSAAHLIYKLF